MELKNVKRVLFLSNCNPAGTGGGHAATRAYLRALRSLMPSAEFDICLYDRYRTDALRFPLDGRNTFYFASQRGMGVRLTTPVTGIMHRFQRLARRLMGEFRYDLVFFGTSHIAGTLLRHVPKDTVTVTLNHNHEPEYFVWEDVSALYKKIFLPHVKRLERIAYKRSTLSLFLTEEDLAKFREVYGETRSRVAVTGYFSDSDERQPVAPIHRNGGRIVITGSLNNPQNVDGIRYFFNELYPQVPAGTDIVIAGQHPTAEVVDLCGRAEGVTLVADPADMGEVVRKGSVFLCVTRVGGGMKIRLTDGLKAGVPVITHEVSARGYGAFRRVGALMSFSTPEEFGEALRTMQPQVAVGTLTSEFISGIYDRELSFKAGVKRLGMALEGTA